MLSKPKSIQLFIIVFLIGLGVFARFLPHPPNFAPIAALALFGACYLPRKWALLLPLAAMFVSDIFIGFYDIGVMLAVYGSFLLIGGMGFLLKKRKNWYFVGGSALLAAVLFFLVTNFAVWAFTPWYAKTFAGLWQSYMLALPFFRYTLLGNLFYVSSFFGVFELANLWLKRKSTAPALAHKDFS